MLKLFAVVAILSLIGVLAFVAQGFDVKNVTMLNHNIWILQKVNPKTADASAPGRYARVNTLDNELGIKNSVASPSELLQSPTGSMLFNQNSSYMSISSSNPDSFLEGSDSAVSLKVKPTSVALDSSVAAIVDAAGAFSLSHYTDGQYTQPVAVPNPSGVAKDYAFSAVAIAADGSVYAFSLSDYTVRQFSLVKNEWTSRKDLVSGAAAGDYQLAVVGGKWTLLSQTDSKAWTEGSASPITVAAGSYLQESSAGSSTAYLSSPTGLQSISNGSVSDVKSVAGAVDTARPIEFGGAIYSAWVSETKGWFYSTQTGELVELPFNGGKLDANNLSKSGSDLVLQTNGESAVINETFTGWAWNLPTGELVQGSQDWDGNLTKVDNCDPTIPGSCKEPPPKPPTPVDDSFGVRAGSLVELPVMLNDSDTNRGDIISIDPGSVTGLNSSFGEARISSNGAMITVAVADGASGTASFKYRLTDGVVRKASKFAKVTLHVVSPGKNTAPGWCTDVIDTCVQNPLAVSVAAGSEITIPYLDGWADMDGDRFFISKATITSGEGNIAFSSSGDLVYQNEGTKDSNVAVQVTVSDVYGAERTKTLAIDVKADGASTLRIPVLNGTTAEPLAVDFSDYVSGSSGDISISQLEPAKANKNSSLQIEQIDATRVNLTAATAGPAILNLTLSNSNGSKVSALVRVNFTDGAGSQLSTSPVTVLVSSGLDTSLDLFKAAYNPLNRALVITSVTTNATNGSSIFADKIKGGFIRIRGNTKANTAGFVGVVNYKISDGSGDSDYTATGQAFVYEMTEEQAHSPVARLDSVTVRAKDSAAVDVLANDVGDPGVPLVIDSKSLKQDPKASCIEGGLIFASGGKLRVVAPSKPGLYTCGYSIYPASSPSVKATATLKIHVIQGDESNQLPLPVNLYARVRAGESVNIPIPLVGVDPDGDGVSVKAISGVKGDKGAAYINPEGTSIEYTAVSGVKGQDVFKYTLVDSKNGVSLPATVKVAISDTDPDTAPVTMNDYAEVRIGKSNKVTIDPASNDYDPQPDVKHPIALVTTKNGKAFAPVTPDAPQNSENYKLWASHVSVHNNKVVITSSEQPMQMRFVYRVKGSTGSESLGYITVKVTKDAVEDAPDITDTFVSPADQVSKLATPGIDVVTDKVLWKSGDVSTLKLSIWGGLSGFSVPSGNNTVISSQSIPKDPGVVIFKLSGTNYYGKEVESYGFMHLPGTTPSITFDPQKNRVKVQEDSSATFDIAKMLNLAGQIQVGKVQAHGLRDQATCRLTSGTQLQYSAGSGEPWTDFCDVAVKVSGSSEDFTTIMVPIKIIPANPEPELSGRTMTILPGDTNTQVLDLRDITAWEGKTRDSFSQLNYKVEGGTDLFKIVQDGYTLKITAIGSSPAGSIRKLRVSIGNHPKTAPVNIVLLVGQLPNELPVGANLALDCGVNDNVSDCQVTKAQLNNGPGVYNPFPGDDLTFAPFGYTTGAVNYAAGQDIVCGEVKLHATADAITAKWNQAAGKKAAGSKCTINYHVFDREQRLGTGVLEFSFKGVPGKVRSVTQVAYSATTITLQIVAPKSSYPGIDGFDVSQDGGDAFDCPIDAGLEVARCVIRNVQPYDGKTKSNLHKYSVRARNSEGDSNVPQLLEGAYSYRPPKALTSDNIRATTVYDPQATSSAGYADVTIYPVADASVKSYSLSSDVPGSGVDKTISDTTAPFHVRVAAKPGFKSSIRVSAVGDVKPPVGSATDAGSSATWVGRIASIPRVSSISAKVLKSGSVSTSKISVSSAFRNYSNKPIEVAYVMFPGDQPSCNWDSTANTITITGGSAADSIIETREYASSDQQTEDIGSPELRPILDNTTYTPMICYANGFGKTVVTGRSLSTLSDPADGDFTYIVNANPNADNAWLVSLAHTVTSPGVYPQFNGSKTDSNDWRNSIYSTSFGEDPVIKVRYCKNGSTTECSNGDRVVTAEDSTRSWQLKVTGIDKMLNAETNAEITACVPRTYIDFKLLGSGLTKGQTNLWQLAEGSQYVNSSGAYDLDKPDDRWKIPPRAGTVTKLVLKVQGNSSASTRHVQGLTGTATLEFTCH